MDTTTKKLNNEVILFDGPESSLVYEFDGDKTLAIYEPDYTNQLQVINFKNPADLETIQDAIKRCEESYLAEVNG
jgi:hypothetical protein